jgi:hypothetical protein
MSRGRNPLPKERVHCFSRDTTGRDYDLTLWVCTSDVDKFEFRQPYRSAMGEQRHSFCHPLSAGDTNVIVEVFVLIGGNLADNTTSSRGPKFTRRIRL